MLLSVALRGPSTRFVRAKAHQRYLQLLDALYLTVVKMD